MDVVITFKNGGEFVWKNVKTSELSSIFTDIADLAEKDQEARKAARLFKKQGRVNGRKKCLKKAPKR
jgi:hypothetical protein